jgi:hypothetical protein
MTGGGMPAGLVLALSDAIDNLTATGTTQADALELWNAINRVSTVSSGTGVKLPKNTQQGDEVLIYNDGANSLTVYPASGDSIDDYGADASISIESGYSAVFTKHRGTLWSMQSNSAADNSFVQSGAGATSTTLQDEARRVVYLDQFGTSGDGSTDDLSKINACLLAHQGKVIRGTPGKNYAISGSMVIYSDTVLDLTGCTVTLKASSNSNMIHNAAWVAGSGRDSNIEIRGGTWARGSNAGSGQALHSILLQRVDQPYVHDLEVTSSAGKYAVSFYACNNFKANRLTFDVASDGVHIEGECTGGEITNIYGSTGDDSVGITPANYVTSQNGDLGDIKDVRVEGVYTTSLTNGVRIVVGSDNGTPYGCYNVIVRDIDVAASGNAVKMGGDTADSACQNGYLFDIDVSHVNNSAAGAVIVQDFGASGLAHNLTFSHISLPNVALKAAILFDSTNADMTVSKVTIRDCFFSSANGSNPIKVDQGAVIEHMQIEGVYFNPPAGTYGVSIANGSTVNTLVFDNCRLKVQTTSAGLLSCISASNVLTDLFINNLTYDQGSWMADLGNVTTNVYIDGMKGVTNSGLMNVRSSTAVTIRKIHGLSSSTHQRITNAGTLNNAFYIGLNRVTAPTYSASITPDLINGNWQNIVVTNGSAFTINAPTNPPTSSTSATLTIEIFNNSGGAMGAITWNAAFVMPGGAFTNPATGTKRFIRFEWNGSKWVETSRAGADY